MIRNTIDTVKAKIQDKEGISTISILRHKGMLTVYLDKLHEAIYHKDIKTFLFEGKYLSTTEAGMTMCIVYLATIFILSRKKKPFTIPNWIPALHNLFLTLVSLFLFIVLTENSMSIFINKGMYESFCLLQSYTPRVEFIMYLNYLTKYYELIDTLFLVLKGKELQFLHVYHHSSLYSYRYDIAALFV